MGQGSQSRGLIIASKTMGWDPTKIGGDFDVAAGLNNRAGTGPLPAGTGEHPAIGPMPEAPLPKSTRTRNADPTPGMPGA